jgi:hypothetical protein
MRTPKTLLRYRHLELELVEERDSLPLLDQRSHDAAIATVAAGHFA